MSDNIICPNMILGVYLKQLERGDYDFHLKKPWIFHGFFVLKKEVI
jgi:hypothetical protein